MSLVEPVAEPQIEPMVESAEAGEAAADDLDLGAELVDDELGELLVREITIDGMCGVY
jgi:mycofactocin precursor